jgi:hypothetical protein
MPKKQKPLDEIKPPLEASQSVTTVVATEQIYTKANDLQLCGHVNLHSGKLKLKCTLPADHAGAHSAPYKRVVNDEDDTVDAMCGWNDDAGIPPKE